nr:hypothetical protein [uncultured Desulfobacter sp.]
MQINTAAAKQIVLVAMALMLLMIPGLKLPYLDKKADAYFSGAITKATLTGLGQEREVSA